MQIGSNAPMPRRFQLSLRSVLYVLLAVGCSMEPIEKTEQPATKAGRVEEPVIRAYLLDGEYYERRAIETGEDGPVAPPDNSFRTWPILQSKGISAQELASSIREAISNKANFGRGGADCFNPGMGISIGEGDDQLDAVVCIECEWLYLFEPGKKVEQKTLSAAGKREFARLYAAIFPEESKARIRN